MSKKSGSVCRLCRRENMKLFLKGERCYTDKCAFERRPYPPGQHGQSRLKFSEYALQLREKQKLRRWYFLEEKTFYNLFARASGLPGNTGEVFLKLLEMRLDNVAFLAGFGVSRRQARQLVSHGHILVNGKRINLPGYTVRVGDRISVRPESQGLVPIQQGVQLASKRQVPGWLQVDFNKFEVSVIAEPTRAEITAPVEERMVTEFYSR